MIDDTKSIGILRYPNKAQNEYHKLHAKESIVFKIIQKVEIRVSRDSRARKLQMHDKNMLTIEVLVQISIFIDKKYVVIIHV